MQINNSEFKNLSEHFPHVSQEAIVPVIAMIDNQAVSIGTAFCINPSGIFMTAGHVIKDAIKRAIRIIGDDGKFRDDINLYILYVSSSKNPDDSFIGGLMNIQKCWMNNDHDIAVFRVRMGQLNGEIYPKLPILPMTINIPNINQEIIGAGYHTMKSDYKNLVLNQVQKYSYTTGRVIELYPESRDSIMINFPCFRTNARFDPGMSGGPIFCNERVCGIICSGYGLIEDTTDYISYGALLWIAMSLSIETISSDNIIQESNLLEWGKNGYINIDKSINNIIVYKDDQNKNHISFIQA